MLVGSYGKEGSAATWARKPVVRSVPKCSIERIAQAGPFLFYQYLEAEYSACHRAQKQLHQRAPDIFNKCWSKHCINEELHVTRSPQSEQDGVSKAE